MTLISVMETLGTESVKQDQRTFLRERFLRMIGMLTDLQADILMYGRTKVKADLGATDIDVQNIQVRNLETPMGTVANAIMRTSDIVSITVNDISEIST